MRFTSFSGLFFRTQTISIEEGEYNANKISNQFTDTKKLKTKTKSYDDTNQDRLRVYMYLYEFLTFLYLKYLTNLGTL